MNRERFGELLGAGALAFAAEGAVAGATPARSAAAIVGLEECCGDQGRSWGDHGEMIIGLEECCGADGTMQSGGAVLTLVAERRALEKGTAGTAAEGTEGAAAEGTEGAAAEVTEGVAAEGVAAAEGKAEVALASVVVVLSPGGLAVWAPKEEIKGLLALLPGPDE